MSVKNHCINYIIHIYSKKHEIDSESILQELKGLSCLEHLKIMRNSTDGKTTLAVQGYTIAYDSDDSDLQKLEDNIRNSLTFLKKYRVIVNLSFMIRPIKGDN